MDWPNILGARAADQGSVTASSTGTLVTCGSANVKGSYSQIVAATDFAADLVLVQAHFPTTQGSTLLDIAVGAAASEQIVIPDLLMGFRVNQGVCFLLPVHIPAGSRIAARAQSSASSIAVHVSVETLAAPWLRLPGGGRVTAYGVNTADSGAQSVDPGAVLNTKGAYAQLTASCNRIRKLMAVVGDNDDQTRSDAAWLLDLAVGAGGSESIFLPNLRLASGLTSDMVTPMVLGPFPVDIPAGSRLAARSQCSITTTGDRLFDLALYGVS